MKDWILISLLSLAPVSELRGSLPYALAVGTQWSVAYVWCVGLNALVSPLAYLFLDTVHKLLYRWSFYASFFDRLIYRTRHKMEARVARWGFWGVAAFVAIPLPVTGAWSGTFGAWFLGLERHKTILAVSLGVAIAGLIVSAVALTGFHFLDLFISHVQ